MWNKIERFRKVITLKVQQEINLLMEHQFEVIKELFMIKPRRKTPNIIYFRSSAVYFHHVIVHHIDNCQAVCLMITKSPRIEYCWPIIKISLAIVHDAGLLHNLFSIWIFCPLRILFICDNKELLVACVVIKIFHGNSRTFCVSLAACREV